MTLFCRLEGCWGLGVWLSQSTSPQNVFSGRPKLLKCTLKVCLLKILHSGSGVPATEFLTSSPNDLATPGVIEWLINLAPILSPESWQDSNRLQGLEHLINYKCCPLSPGPTEMYIQVEKKLSCPSPKPAAILSMAPRGRAWPFLNVGCVCVHVRPWACYKKPQSLVCSPGLFFTESKKVSTKKTQTFPVS